MKRMLTAIAATLALAIGTPAAAVDIGAETETVETVRVETESGGLTFSVEYTFGDPAVLDDELLAELSVSDDYTVLVAFNSEGQEVYRDRGASAQQTQTISPQRESSLVLPRNRPYVETKTTTRFSIQRACGSTRPSGDFN